MGKGSGNVCGRPGLGQRWGQALDLWARLPALPHLSRDGIPGERGAPQAVGRERGTGREMERQGDTEEVD